MNADLYTPPGDGIITGALIEDNILYDNGVGGGGAINMDGVQDSVVRNNLLFNNHASGIILFQIDGAEGPRENWIYHNTIDQASNGRWALGLKQTTGTNYVRNNILYNRGSFRGGLQFGNASDADNTDTDYNVVNLITIDDGDSRLSLAQWQAQGPDQHSRTGAVAALFVDANRGNYLLGTNSPAVDAAQLLSTMLTDMDGAPRLFGSAPDMGCYEQRPLALQLVSTNPSSFRIELSGGAGRSNAIETSTALTNWMRLTSLTRSNLPLETAITNDGTHRFYRAVCIP
jgi:hypothetical protein